MYSLRKDQNFGDVKVKYESYKFQLPIGLEVIFHTIKQLRRPRKYTT